MRAAAGPCTIARMRMFVAALPPEEVLADLDEFLDVRREAAEFRWSSSEQWHLTLAFLAEVSDRQLDGLVERLTAAAGRRAPLTLRLAGGGAFPDPSRARVLYAGVGADLAELDRLAAAARAAAVGAGVRVDGTRFRPHVTLARLSRAQEVTRWLRILDTYRGPSWPLTELALVESRLGEGPRRRPRHEVRETLRIG